MEPVNDEEVTITFREEPAELVLAPGHMGPFLTEGAAVVPGKRMVLAWAEGMISLMQIDGHEEIYPYQMVGRQFSLKVIKGAVEEIRKHEIDPGSLVRVYRPRLLLSDEAHE